MSGQKRSYQQQGESEVFVDDLAVAAVFAVPSTLNEASNRKDENEIELDSSTSDNDTSGETKNDSTLEASDAEDFAVEETAKESQNKEDPDHDNEDVVSDVDFAEELQHMTQEGIDEEEEEEGSGNGTGQTKTIHEVDAYKANAARLKSEFGLDVTLEEQEMLVSEPPHQAQLNVAGRIQHYMASERTMVIRSQQGGLLLEEGTFLFIRISSSETKGEKVVPLGRILEVFGPVSQPLYSLRLPEPLPEDSDAAAEADQKSIRDPWAENGEYTLLLNEPSASWNAFYVPKGAKILDTSAIYRSSGRGCDASNIFDEEITNPNDIEYSDDEQERIAKRRGGRTRQRVSDQPKRSSGPAIRAVGSPIRGFYPHARLPAVVPGYRTPTQPQYLQHYPAAPGMTYPSYGGYPQHVASQHIASQHGASYPVPPPPPADPDESDTVYFDMT